MGRKPNQLILEFFDRGPKLEDASNRYQHTCKSCGETFPKGRIDSLTTHLIKKCPSVSQPDRDRALMQLRDLPDPEATETARQTIKSRATSGSSPTKTLANGEKVDLPITTRNWTPLEALAEVSRQITDHPDKPSSSAKASKRDETLENGGEPAASQRQLQLLPIDPTILADSPENHQSLVTALQASSNGQALPPITSFASVSPRPSPRLPGLDLGAEDGEMDGLPLSASHKNALATDAQAALLKPGLPLEPELSGIAQNAGITDKFFPKTSTTWPLVQQGTHADTLFFDSPIDETLNGHGGAKGRAATFPRPIAMNAGSPHRGFGSEFNTTLRPMKPKVRGRFTASRRKEVQEVRKRGACIRCRMLKKPCSGESPCSTCRNVESARLWKQPCVRTRIADELEVYSTGLHNSLAYHDVARVKNQVRFRASQHRLEVSHFADVGTSASFCLLEAQGPNPSLEEAGHDSEGGGMRAPLHIRLLDTEAEDLSGVLETYIQQMSSTFFDRERSPWMRATLSLSSRLAQDKSDALLGRVLELWSTNHVLVDLDMVWTTYETREATADSDAIRILINAETDEASYRLLCTQLRAAAEKRAAKVAKHVMHELERRLLQRAQSGCFETFLVAICLLNCVERLTWHFHGWEQAQPRSKWPLDRQPHYFCEQGERFADLVQMLLKMRGLPPKTYVSPDGILATDGDEAAREYLVSINLTKEEVEDRQNAVFDPDDSRSLDMKFCSKLLLPG
ncbi:MAG: hypothetical protein M1825_005584 [Sarcosagium campestre]|nr:MAG: hypothetical protein M1825_005584 [Sarcosagium campestre]